MVYFKPVRPRFVLSHFNYQRTACVPVNSMENLQPKREQITFHSICHKVRLPNAATHGLK